MKTQKGRHGYSLYLNHSLLPSPACGRRVGDEGGPSPTSGKGAQVVTNVAEKKQKGSVLILSLIMLLLLTIIGIAEMSVNTTQTRIATNIVDQQIAFATAEAALNEATNNLIAGQYSSAQFMASANGLYLFNPNNPAIWTTIDWSNGASVIKSFKGSSNIQAAYIIEQLPSIIKGGQNFNAPTQVYRITARSTGASGSTVIILQTTVQIQE